MGKNHFPIAISVADAEFQLLPFQKTSAKILTKWVENPADLHRLAPKTSWPLTAKKVSEWQGPGCEAFELRTLPANAMIGYGEVNWLPGAPGQAWLGHIIIEPGMRGRGLGCVLVQALLEQAFLRRGARSVSLIVFPDNVAAIDCYLRVGFQHVGEEKHRCGARGGYEVLRRLQITKAQFSKSGLSLQHH